MFLLVQLYPVQLTVLKIFSQVLICRLLYISNLFLERLILDFDPRPNLFAPIIAWTPDSCRKQREHAPKRSDVRDLSLACAGVNLPVSFGHIKHEVFTPKRKKHILGNNYYHVVMAVISVQSSGGYASFFQGVTTRFDGLTTWTCLRDTQVKEVLGTNCWRSLAYLVQPVQPTS